MYGVVRRFPFIETTLLGLVLSTTLLLTWQHFGMNRVYEIGSANGHIVTANDDKEDDGNSVASITYSNKFPTLNCHLGDKYQYPACGIQFQLGKSMSEGVDLSNYDSISFDVGFKGPGEHSVRLFLRNFENGVSNATDRRRLKVNELEFELPPGGRINIPIKFLRVASWWASERKIAWHHTDMRIDNVSLAELETGSLATSGDFQLEVRAIKFHGKWVSKTQLMAFLVEAWVAFGITVLLIQLRRFRQGFIAAKSRLLRVQSINNALKLETIELAGQARTDPLTGALNREGLREYLSKKLDPALGQDVNICLIFADLDHFKKVNDNYGHPVGDAVIQQFSGLIQNKIRDADKLVRWGGEEFLIVCSKIEIGQAFRVAEKLRLSVLNDVWPNDLKITSSFGVAAYRPGEDFAQTIKRADDALYKAKANGRNCVEMGEQ